MKSALQSALMLLILVGHTTGESFDPHMIPSPAERGLIVHYELLTPAYLIAEPIYFYQWIENTTDDFQYYRWEEVREFKILDESSKEIPLKQGWFDIAYVAGPFVPGKGDGVWRAVPPKSSTGRLTPNVLEHFGDGNAYMNYYLAPGKYKLTSDFVVSDTISFLVTAPLTEADKAASTKLIDLLETSISWADPNVTIPLYESLLTDCPSSPYVPMLLEKLINLYQLSETHRDSTKVQRYALQMIEGFPTSPAAEVAYQDLNLDLLSGTQRASLAEKLRTARNSLSETWLRRDIDSLLQRLGR